MPGLPFPCQIDEGGGSDSSPSSPVTFVSTDGPVATFEALLVPGHVISVGSLGGLKAIQFVINEARGMVDEHDIVEVGVRGGDDVGVVGEASSGTVIDADRSDYHCSGVDVVGESANSVGSASGCGSSGAVSASLPGAICAFVSCPIGRCSEEDENVGGVCVCVVWVR